MLSRRNPQLNAHGELIHLLSIEGLPRAVLTQILDTAGTFLSVNDRDVKKVPLLRGKSVFNLFFENSTRTRTTFEIAAKRLSADVINLDIARSSTAKGESLLDTIANLSAMHADMFVVRHGESGAPYLVAQHCAPHVHVVNAGDGRHAHPTQGLLDMYTIRHFKGDFTGLTVAVVGDIVHSRVARSDIHALATLASPLVASVNGMAVGVGATMLLHCDMVLAARSASFRFPFVDLGVFPEAASTVLLPRIAGHQKAMELFLLGDRFDAEVAREAGMVNRICEDDALEAESLALARRLAQKPASALRATKARVRAGYGDLSAVIDAELGPFGAMVRSPEAQEAFSAFLEKRKPDFSRFD